jgi:hypothetical protein
MVSLDVTTCALLEECQCLRKNFPHILQQKGQSESSYKTILVITHIRFKSNFTTSIINDEMVVLHSFDPVISR